MILNLQKSLEKIMLSIKKDLRVNLSTTMLHPRYFSRILVYKRVTNQYRRSIRRYSNKI